MNLALVTYEYEINGGGLSFSCQNFHNLLRALGHRVTLISSKVGGDLYTVGGYDPLLGQAIVNEVSLKDNLKLVKEVDLIIAFGGNFNGYYASLLAVKVSCPCWILFRGSDANLCKWDSSRMIQNKFAVNNAQKIIALSQEIAENIQLLYPECKTIQVIQNHTNRISKEIIKHHRDYFVLGTGATHINEKKGIMYLIKIIKDIKLRYPKRKVILEIAGAIDADVQKQYFQKIEQLELNDNIKFLGQLSRSDFYNRQQLWDAYIQTSVCEGMGNSVVDSMSMGLPVLITDTGFVAEAAREHCPDILLPINDSPVAADAIVNMLTNQEELNKLSSFYDYFFDSTSEEKVSQKWKTLLQNKTQQYTKLPTGIMAVTFHDVAGDVNDNITITVEAFKHFVEVIYRSGYTLCSMNQYLRSSCKDKEHSIVCTFDDGYVGVFQHALPLMRQYGFTATVFVCTDYIGKLNNWNLKDKVSRLHMNLSQLRNLQEAGWEIGSHGANHCSLLRLDEVSLENTLALSKSLLEELLGTPIHSFAYPYGDSNQFVQNIVKKFYDYGFALTEGGTHLEVDAFRIRRYFTSEIYKILNLK